MSKNKVTTGIIYAYKCNKCLALSDPLKISEYIRLEANQVWYCEKCKPEKDTQTTIVRKLSNGYIIQNNDF